jgi:ubiquinone/menaquinone biosynthesis C-methylase UbiE
VITDFEVDRIGYNNFYSEKLSEFYYAKNREDFKTIYEANELKPSSEGGRNYFGYTRYLTVKRMLDDIRKKKDSIQNIKIIDAGCGLGNLSSYLAALGFKVYGIDISRDGITASKKLSKKIGTDRNCEFITGNLNNIDLPDNSIDYVIGHSTLHHFIKYDEVPNEFKRLLKNGSKGFFAESLGEFFGYRLFHNKIQMKELGDIVLKRKQIIDYFRDFDVEIMPTDCFVTIDKLLSRMRIIKMKNKNMISKITFWLDRKIYTKIFPAAYFANSIVIEITNKK